MTLALPRSWLTRGESVYRTPGPETPPASIQNTSTTPPRYKGEKGEFSGQHPPRPPSGGAALWDSRPKSKRSNSALRAQGAPSPLEPPSEGHGPLDSPWRLPPVMGGGETRLSARTLASDRVATGEGAPCDPFGGAHQAGWRPIGEQTNPVV